MKKESVNKFDLEAAFKALEEIEVPVVKGIKPNRENLQEKFTKKSTTEILVEDYFDVNDQGDLEAAQEEREAEIAKAKLARIEKIVDLDAESEEDLLPSYVGKFIIQCPQCMTLFYKNQEDIEKSEENPEVVNINEVCQHCGNTSGYTLIGKVDNVGEEEAENYDVEDFDENELNLDFDTEEPVEEESTEEEPVEDVTAEEGNEEELELEPVEETEEENSEEEEVKESLNEASREKVNIHSEAVGEIITVNRQDLALAHDLDKKACEIYDTESAKEDFEDKEDELCVKYGVHDFCGVELFGALAEEVSLEWTIADIKNASDLLTEAVDKELDDKLKAHNEYIEYLKDMIEKEEKSLANAKNDFVKKSIQSRIDALQADLEAALPEALKGEIETELPTAEEVELEATENTEEKEETKESLKEAYYACAEIDGEERRFPFNTREEAKKYIDMIQKGEAKEFEGKEIGSTWTESLEEELNEEVKLISDLSDYTPWSGAVDTWNQIKDENKVNELDSMLEEIYPDGLTMTELNDILWFDSEWVLSSLGIIEEVEESLKEGSREDRVSNLKRSLTTVELLVKELSQHEMFKELSVRTIQRILIPYFIDNMGRENLSVEKVVSFFEDEGFGTYVWEHYTDLELKQIKELLKADTCAVEALEEYLRKHGISPEVGDYMGSRFEELFDLSLGTVYMQDGEFETLDEIEKIYTDILLARPVETKEALVGDVNINLDARGQSVGLLKGQGGEVHNDMTEDKENLDEFIGPAIASIAGASVANNLVNKAFSEEVEELKEAGDLDTLLDSEEFKKPISEAEVDRILAKYESLEEDVEPGIESELAIQDIVDTWESVEEIDEESLDKLTENYLTEVYSNVKSFKTTDCSLAENKLVVEGKITFNSGKTKNTKFIYEATKTADNKLVLEGLNADFATEKAFVLNCNLDTANRLVVESLNYKYTINNTLVEGLTK